jgi:hypothetical protein
VPQPALGEQPGARVGHRSHDRLDAFDRDPLTEASEPRRRGERVDRLRHLDFASFGRGRPLRSFSVTCTGKRLASGARWPCPTPGCPGIFGLRPAPGRAPPRPGRNGSRGAVCLPRAADETRLGATGLAPACRNPELGRRRHDDSALLLRRSLGCKLEVGRAYGSQSFWRRINRSASVPGLPERQVSGASKEVATCSDPCPAIPFLPAFAPGIRQCHGCVSDRPATARRWPGSACPPARSCGSRAAPASAGSRTSRRAARAGCP